MPSWARVVQTANWAIGGMFGPDGEVVGIESEFLLKILDDGGVFRRRARCQPWRGSCR